MPLTNADVIVLRGLALQRREDPGCPCTGRAHGLADLLRIQVKDLADADLAAVLLWAGSYLHHQAIDHDLAPIELGALLRDAAVHLAALEIGDIPT